MSAPTKKDAIWLAGVMDSFGQIGIKRLKTFAKFKSAYPDRLEAIAAALGADRTPSGPFAPAGISKKPHYELVIAGRDLVRLENLVVSEMRTAKRQLFEEARRKIRALKAKMGFPIGLPNEDEE
ncbi:MULTISPECIES: hypothetical protein [unclassified Bradyrhizobium]|uniref:hypothetical protein n=1 Tax=unclassified Bradyrhizobium TaxID=2631580 RepID=UPI001FF782DF|nr:MULTISPECIES: hypothetical protein [unclassified Bradyrhizobium]MCK1709074.1 hypothetical protein [Bradyrhizobium sp. 143]MCK1724018.1 hypothetical protein [Bradyrhizobium sp. 142]